MTGVFMKITNKTKRAITLLSGTSSFAPMIETHQVVDDVMSKTARGIKIMPGKSVMLEPGGLHVMLMGLKKVILPGTKVDLTLTFAGAKPVVLKPMIAKTVAAGEETYDPGMKH
jgi:copper(I)-binding protein